MIKIIKFLVESFLYKFLPEWDLRLRLLWIWVYRGKDDKARIRDLYALIRKYSRDSKKKCLSVGVPSHLYRKYADNFTSIDLYDKRDCIDVRCDLAKTPFTNNYFNFLVCNAILEHVKDPFVCVRELYRIAAPKAEIWVEVPFVQGFHPVKDWNPNMPLFIEKNKFGYQKDEYHGGDYWRFTPQGIIALMSPFKLKKIYLINQGAIAFYGEK